MVECLMNSVARMMWSKQFSYLFTKCSRMKSTILLRVASLFISSYSQMTFTHLWNMHILKSQTSRTLISFFDNFLNIFFHPAWSVFSPAAITMKRVFKHIIIFLWIAYAIIYSSISSYLIVLKKIWQSFKLNILIKIKIQFYSSQAFFSFLRKRECGVEKASVKYLCLFYEYLPSFIYCLFQIRLNFTGTYVNSQKNKSEEWRFFNMLTMLRIFFSFHVSWISRATFFF